MQRLTETLALTLIVAIVALCVWGALDHTAERARTNATVWQDRANRR